MVTAENHSPTPRLERTGRSTPARVAEAVVGLATAAFITACTIGPLYSIRVRMNPVVTGSLIDDRRLNLAFTLVQLVALSVALIATRYNPVPAGIARTHSARLALAALVAGHALVLVSASWSTVQGRSLIQAALFALTTATAIALGTQLRLRVLAGAIFVTHQALLMWSVWAVRRYWPGAVDHNADWTGLFFNKNSLGPVAALALISCAVLAYLWVPTLANGQRSVAYVVLALAALADVGLLYKSDALTSVVGVGIAGLCAAVTARVKRRDDLQTERKGPAGAAAIAAGFFAVILGAIAAVAIGRSFAAPYLERSPTLSGRTELWGWLLPRVGERPIGGWGWLSVWEEPDLRQQIVERFDVPFATAHNGLLEVALGAGIPAMVVVAVAIGALVWQPFSWLAATRPGPERRRASVAVAICGYFVAVNSLETFIGANLLPWAMLVMVCTISARELVPLRTATADPRPEVAPARQP